MPPNSSFEQFLTNGSAHIDIWQFIINLLITAALSLTLAKVYATYGLAISNRRMFARNFLLIATTTMVIITVVKSSLALSLGLVGALSIVRFRSAIKEPEELSYLFLLISVGLGLGANQRLVTLVAFVMLVSMIILVNKFSSREQHQNMYLAVSTPTTGEGALSGIIEVLKTHCGQVQLKRFDDSNDRFEGTFLVEFDNIEQLEKSRSAIRNLHEKANVVFMDSKLT